MALQRSLAPLLFSLSLLLFAGCAAPEGSGTAVGNPGVVAFALGAPSDLTVAEGLTGFAEGTLAACDGGAPGTVEGPEEALGFTDVAFELPEGTWCSLTLNELATEFEGARVDDEEDSFYSVSLELGSLTLNAPSIAGFTVGADQVLVLELGAPNWLSAGDLGLDVGGEVEIAAVDPEAAVLATTAAAASQLFDDTDEDGEVSDSERSSGAPAATSNPTPEAGDDGTPPACSSGGGGSPSLFLLFGAMAGLLRRRATPSAARLGRASSQ
ncbi:MAG: hypothetical protein KDA24_12360 [Deltaproteobacteria bacterium]|nr:hypothetical protein [Deltaproteobacteria bacterium]